jgi:phage terminase Nu1 subunit (DNA packaging protein)
MSLLSETELRQALGVPAKRLRKWMRRGLPATGRGRTRRFDEAAVAAWLTEHGLAQPAPPPEAIATTREEAARLLRVNLRTLAGWLTEPGFPGKAGTPGRRDGYFPIEQIEAWRAARFAHAPAAASDETSRLRQKKLGFEVDEAQLDLETKLGTLLDKEQTAQLIERVIATAKAQLEEFPDQVDALLPAKAGPRLRSKVRRAAAKKIRQVLRTLAELVAGDTDAAEEASEQRG